MDQRRTRRRSPTGYGIPKLKRGSVYKEHEVVVLTRDLPENGLLAGDVGAVVGHYAAGGYEVEFAAADGSTIAVVTVGDDAIRSPRRREILHVREVA
ncbi:DUF4926 domain-containing protein [Mycolicibacter senuensis]|uniref:DUF4926 domain-containing protein n=1 Tax=Mycolicibacter senuensis TaxID=386913 RepID=UPI0025705AD4|nr:DUF4926 domain-containing protein [Mycolicibacter senuensis]